LVVNDGLSAIDRSLADARALIAPRAVPSGLTDEILTGALVVDIRPEGLRERDGTLEGAVIVERNVLEWRLDPTSAHRLPEMDDDPDRRVIIVCDEGFASSLAAAVLACLGLTNVTDLDGGYQAWRSQQMDQ
jgi:rhodanese-related sulfurtransferase